MCPTCWGLKWSCLASYGGVLRILPGTFASRELESERRHQPSPSYSSRGCSSIKQAGLVVRNRSLSGFMIHDGSKAGLQFSLGIHGHGIWLPPSCSLFLFLAQQENFISQS